MPMELGPRSHQGASLSLELFGPMPDDYLRQIVRLQTDPERRRQGDATRLLRMTCDEADVNETVLVLSAAPFGPAPVDGAHLAAWYRRFGFRLVQSAPMLLFARQNRRVVRGRVH